MTQTELIREVAQSARNFEHMESVPFTRQPVEVEREPLVIDWDEIPDRRYLLLP